MIFEIFKKLFTRMNTAPSNTNTQLQENKGLAHDAFFNELRKSEFARLDDEKHVYLDYTGGSLYSSSLIEKHFYLLKKYTFGNPHSSNPTSKFATQLVEESRNAVIQYFNASDYYCIFTQNASMALQIVGENYPFEEDGHYLSCIDNHNSVNGIREYCTRNRGSHDFFSVNIEDLTIAYQDLEEKLIACKNKNKLLAFPAQSNVSGVKHDLQLIQKAKNLGWDVLLDAAAFVPTSILDLQQYKPDFVSISFYKIFGYPTGIGCLLVSKSKFEKLHKRWFAGGTVNLASAKTSFYYLTENHERFENGTVNYLGLSAIKMGLDFIQEIGMQRINERMYSLSEYLFAQLINLKHTNGTHQLQIFGPTQRIHCGGTFIMNFYNPDGAKVRFEKIEELCNAKNISIRSGCFCNPGLDETNNCLTSEELVSYFSSNKNGNYHSMMNTLQKMRGAVRISIGIATTKKDIDTFLQFVTEQKDIYIENSLVSHTA